MDTNNNINNFFLNAVVRDFSRDFLFRIQSINFDGGASIKESDLIYAKTGSLPARKIGNVTAKYAGLTFNMPGAVEFENSASYDIEFYCPEDGNLRNIFLNESQRTFSHITGVAGGQSATGSYPGTIANPNSTMVLKQLDKNLNDVAIFELIGCSIRDVGGMEYKIAEGTGDIMSFKVSIAYHFFNFAPVLQTVI